MGIGTYIADFSCGRRLRRDFAAHHVKGLMFHLNVIATLDSSQRDAVDQLILDVWSHEAEVAHDVEVLAQRGVSVIDPLDDRSVHLLVWSDERLVGYSRLSIFITEQALDLAPVEVPRLARPFRPVAYLSRLVVDPKTRGQGVARLMDQVRVEIAQDSGASAIVVCAVGKIRVDSLEHSGFTSIAQYPDFQNGWYKTSRPTQTMKLMLSPLTVKKSSSSL